MEQEETGNCFDGRGIAARVLSLRMIRWHTFISISNEDFLGQMRTFRDGTFYRSFIMYF